MLVSNPEPILVLAVTEGIRVARHGDGVGVGVGVGDATGVGVGVGVGVGTDPPVIQTASTEALKLL